MLDSGWLKLEYACDPAAQSNVIGVAFNYPEQNMLKKTWLGDGPYRVWRNRLKGATLPCLVTSSDAPGTDVPMPTLSALDVT